MNCGLNDLILPSRKLNKNLRSGVGFYVSHSRIFIFLDGDFYGAFSNIQENI